MWLFIMIDKLSFVLKKDTVVFFCMLDKVSDLNKATEANWFIIFDTLKF